MRELGQLAWQSDRAGLVDTRWDLVVQAPMRALVIERVTKVIEEALLCAKRCRRRFRRALLQRAMHPLMISVPTSYWSARRRERRIEPSQVAASATQKFSTIQALLSPGVGISRIPCRPSGD